MRTEDAVLWSLVRLLIDGLTWQGNYYSGPMTVKWDDAVAGSALP